MSVAADDAARLFDDAACGLLQTAPDGTILRVNRTMATWCGKAPEALCGLRFQDLLTIGSKLFLQTQWMPLLQMQGSVAEVQLEVLHADGKALPMLVNAFARREPGSTAMTRVDIAAMVATDRRKYERELILSRRRAEELLGIVRAGEKEARERAIFAEQLIGIVSHDLRNPLNAVLLGTNVLETSGLETRALGVVTRIASATHRANRLITDLLDFTQARLGDGIRVSPCNVGLHDIAAECIEELRLATPHRRIEHVAVGEGTLQADPDRLTQALGNLLANAIAYGAPDAPIVVTTTVAEADARIEVHNMGPPIPAELQARIFEPMQRGAGAVASRSRSVGLGLYIVREIVRAHRGKAEVRSTEADGTTFTVTLARAAPDGVPP